MYACMYVMYVCMHACMHACMCACVHACMHLCMMYLVSDHIVSRQEVLWQHAGAAAAHGSGGVAVTVPEVHRPHIPALIVCMCLKRESERARERERERERARRGSPVRLCVPCVRPRDRGRLSLELPVHRNDAAGRQFSAPACVS